MSSVNPRFFQTRANIGFLWCCSRQKDEIYKKNCELSYTFIKLPRVIAELYITLPRAPGARQILSRFCFLSRCALFHSNIIYSFPLFFCVYRTHFIFVQPPSMSRYFHQWNTGLSTAWCSCLFKIRRPRGPSRKSTRQPRARAASAPPPPL